MSNVKRGTYMVEYFNGDKYIFGNNYKSWMTHAIELAKERHRDKGVSNHQMFKAVYYSRVPFVDDGGLKYCLADHYQQIIDEVAEKTSKVLTRFEDYKFEKQNHELAKLDKALEKW